MTIFIIVICDHRQQVTYKTPGSIWVDDRRIHYNVVIDPATRDTQSRLGEEYIAGITDEQLDVDHAIGKGPVPLLIQGEEPVLVEHEIQKLYSKPKNIHNKENN